MFLFCITFVVNVVVLCSVSLNDSDHVLHLGESHSWRDGNSVGNNSLRVAGLLTRAA